MEAKRYRIVVQYRSDRIIPTPGDIDSIVPSARDASLVDGQRASLFSVMNTTGGNIADGTIDVIYFNGMAYYPEKK